MGTGRHYRDKRGGVGDPPHASRHGHVSVCPATFLIRFVAEYPV